MKYGYARVSTDDQKADLQHAALKKAGCKKVFTDSGKHRSDAGDAENHQEPVRRLPVPSNSLAQFRSSSVHHTLRLRTSQPDLRLPNRSHP
jgi:hypothetical protein